VREKHSSYKYISSECSSIGRLEGLDVAENHIDYTFVNVELTVGVAPLQLPPVARDQLPMKFGAPCSEFPQRGNLLWCNLPDLLVFIRTRRGEMTKKVVARPVQGNRRGWSYSPNPGVLLPSYSGGVLPQLEALLSCTGGVAAQPSATPDL
jgi:hypothetical protein